MWRKLRQAICWILGRKNIENCRFEVKTSHPDEVICSGCKHNHWEWRDKYSKEKMTNESKSDLRK